MRPPRWRCGEPGCPKAHRPQPVDTWGEYDDVDVALAELEAHYAHHHPEEVRHELSAVPHAA